MKHIGVYGGSFNPVHIGHTALASYIVQSGLVHEVWMMVSPLNPLKSDSHDVADARARVDMLELALHGATGLRCDTTELTLPLPTYTIRTLRHLRATHPDCRFTLIIGADNLEVFHRWREADAIIREFGLLVYPRPGHRLPSPLPEGVAAVEGAPLTDISSTFIRRAVAHGMDIRYWVPQGVARYIETNKLYNIH